MEQELLSKERKTTNRLTTSEKFRCFVYFLAIACMFSCIVVLFVSLVSMERRVALVENMLSEISEELKQIRSKNDAKESPSDVHVRHERNANPTTTLANLTKRIIALEGRSTFRGQLTTTDIFSFCFVSVFCLFVYFKSVHCQGAQDRM